jgi:pimeloyl-ACP methyl ester carboxylesterase
MGGAVALSAALLAPQRVDGLGLLCCAAKLALPEGTLDVLEHRFEHFCGQFAGVALPRGIGSQEQHRMRPIFPQASQAEVLADFRAVEAFDVTALLAGVQHPTVVVAGDQDIVTPLPDCQRLAASLKGARLVVVSGAGHLLPRENPAAAAAALRPLFRA